MQFPRQLSPGRAAPRRAGRARLALNKCNTRATPHVHGFTCALPAFLNTHRRSDSLSTRFATVSRADLIRSVIQRERLSQLISSSKPFFDDKFIHNHEFLVNLTKSQIPRTPLWNPQEARSRDHTDRSAHSHIRAGIASKYSTSTVIILYISFRSGKNRGDSILNRRPVPFDKRYAI